MTQYRLRVTFSNERHLFGPRQYERELADEFTDWQPNQAQVQALGEKLIKDGAWVTMEANQAPFAAGDRVATPVGEFNIPSGSETFLVPPARIREVQIETQEIADAPASQFPRKACPEFDGRGSSVCHRCGFGEYFHSEAGRIERGEYIAPTDRAMVAGDQWPTDIKRQIAPEHPFESSTSSPNCSRCGLPVEHHDSAIVRSDMTLKEFKARWPVEQEREGD